MQRPITRTSRDESGFTLIELLVAMTLGMIVLIGVLNLLDSGARSATRTSDRVDVTQRGRTAMNAVTRALRSQVCPDGQTPPIVSANGTSVTFYSDANGSLTGDAFTPQAVRIWLDSTYKGGRGAIMQATYPGTSLSATPAQRVLVDDVATAGSTPFLTYYAFDSPTALTTPLSAAITGDPLPTNSLAKVLRVDVGFRVVPSVNGASSGALSGKQLDGLRDSDFESQVWVRNSDYTDQSVTVTNRKWGPRCD